MALRVCIPSHITFLYTHHQLCPSIFQISDTVVDYWWYMYLELPKKESPDESAKNPYIYVLDTQYNRLP